MENFDFYATVRKLLVGSVLIDLDARCNTYVFPDRTIETSCPTLVFDSGFLEVENPFTVTCDGRTSSSTDDAVAAARHLVGRMVADLISETESFKLLFEGGASIVVSLRDEDFVTPEAASFVSNEGPIYTFD